MTRKIATLSGILIGITLVSTLFPAYSRASSPATAKRAAAAHQGNIPNPLPSGTEGPIESAEVENKIYDPNNPNLVVATEWLKLQYEVDYQWVDSGVTTGVSDRSTVWLECANVCLGKKHKSHEECDTSCDRVCAKRHHLVMQGRYEPLYANMRQAEADANKAARASGLADDVREWVTSYTSQKLVEAKQKANEIVTADIPHWAGPCAFAKRAYGLHRYDFKITGKFTRFIRRKQMGVVTERTEPGATHTMIVAYIWLPDTAHPIKEASQVRCSCTEPPPAPVVEIGCPPLPVPPVTDGPSTPEPPKPDMPPKPEPPKTNRTPTFSGLGVRDSNGKLDLSKITPAIQLSLTANGVDLNQIEVKLENKSDSPCTCEFTAGMMCVPDDSSYQGMVCVSNKKVTVQPHMTASCMVPAMCTDIDKKQPDDHCTFSIGECTDEGLTNCARLVNSSRGRGARDQARIWILTNQATLDQVNKRLFPGVPPGYYLNSLYDVSQIGCVDVTTPRFRPCLDPNLLLGPGATPEATTWLVDTLAKVEPNKLTDFLAGNKDKFAAPLNEGDVKPSAIQHTADVALALCGSIQSKTRIMGLDYLMAVPAAQRAAVVQAGGLAMVPAQLTSTEPEEVGTALDVINAYAHKPAADTLKSVAKYGPTEEIKKRAASLLAKLNGM